MAESPGYQVPDLPPVKRTNTTVIWVVVIVCVAGFCVAALLVGAALLLPVFSQARQSAQTTLCMSELKQLNLGLMMYTVENDGRYPSASDWHTRILKTAAREKPYQCPIVAKEDPAAVGYAFNKALEGLEETEVDDSMNTIILFESSNLKPNAAGGAELVPKPGRHGSGNSRSSVFGYADGRVKRVPDSQEPGRWKP